MTWSEMYKLDDCQDQANFFYTTLCSIVEKHAPIRKLKFKNNDKPWVNELFKQCIERRNAAFDVGDMINYRILRNKVNRF